MHRRLFLAAAGTATLAGGLADSFVRGRSARRPARARAIVAARRRASGALAVPNAVEVNLRYLLSLEADRLLHNFYTGAGLAAEGAGRYGGWEADTIAGHTLGPLPVGDGADPCADRRAGTEAPRRYTSSASWPRCRKHGDGYVGALTRKRKDGTVVDGKEIFPEIMRGEIRSGGFDLNGSWSPLYTLHKLFAGLLDVHAIVRQCRRARGRRRPRRLLRESLRRAG